MNSTPEYTKLREELRQAEIALKEQRERVAELRRSLPIDTPLEDFVLQGEERPVKLSELFEDPDKSLVLMHFMFGKKQQQPCPMCTLWADGYDGIVPHLRRRVNFAVAIAGDVAEFGALAQRRGWRHLRAVSTGDTALKRDLGFEDEEGAQSPGVSVFRLRPDGQVLHFYSGNAMMGNGHYRGMDLLSPFWNFLDLTPEGRGDFFPKLED